MYHFSSSQTLRTLLASSLLVTLSVLPASAKPDVPSNLGGGLRQLVEASLSSPMTDAVVAERDGRTDGQGRVLVNIHLDGKLPVAALRTVLEKLQIPVVATDERYRKGTIAVYLPLDKAILISQLSGVRSLTLDRKPIANVGTTTAQSSTVLKTGSVNGTNCSGKCGTGITVGALSDSYNKATTAITTAPQDVTSFDLPGAANNPLNTQPVVVLDDTASGADEGRAMLQIIADEAPKAKLCFATAFTGSVSFAQNIRNLADPNLGCNADVIVDDVTYSDEPFFEDGIIAKAVNDVVAQGVSYFSSAGNTSGIQGYLSDFAVVPDATARALQGNGENINFSLIAPSLSSAGFHDFDPGSRVTVTQTVVTTGSSSGITFQWNDPYDVGQVTTDYNIFVFSADGQTLVQSSTDDNLATDEPNEYISALPAGTYQVVITKKTTANPLATKIRYRSFIGSLTLAEFFTYNTPTTFGHNSSASALGTAAYDYRTAGVPTGTANFPESFTSLGPVTIYFDAQGNRLTNPVTLLKPDIAATDNLNTTFFISGNDTDGDGFPNFTGTSAAAPSAAGVAALLLDAGGGRRSVTPTRMRQLLQTTAVVHDLNPNTAQAIFKSGTVRLSVSTFGDQSNTSSTDPNFFKINYVSRNGASLSSLVINVAPANLKLDNRAAGGFPFTVAPSSTITASQATSNIPVNTASSPSITVTFTPGVFTTGNVFLFGIDRDAVVATGFQAANASGNASDFLGGALGSSYSPAKATITDSAGTVYNLTFANVLGNGYSVLDGYGLVDAQAAVNALP